MVGIFGGGGVKGVFVNWIVVVKCMFFYVFFGMYWGIVELRFFIG